MNPLKPNLKEKERPIFTPTKTKVRDLQVRIDDSGRKEFNENERRDKEEAKEFQSPSIEMRPTGPHLDLGGQNRENLSLLKDKQYHKLTSICLNLNKLKNLDELSNLPLLTKIEAVDNCLTQVNLSFDHLIELNLSDNELTEIPELRRVPKLQILILKGNRIRNIKDKLAPVASSLYELDLSGNELAYENVNHVKFIVDEFKILEKVQKINIAGNSLMKQFPEIWRYIVKEVRSPITHFNGEKLKIDVVNMIKQQQLKSWSDLPIMGEESEERKSRATLQRSLNEETDRLTKMLKNLEDASTTPTKCVEFISEVATIANELASQTEVEWEKVFFSKKKQHEINEKIESFLENCVILIENQHATQSTLLSSLASLTVISTSDFGKKCLVLMGDFLNPGTSRQLQMIIKKKIKHIVIPNLHQNSTKNLPIPVLQGLIEIIKDEDLGALFSDTCVFFIKWIKEISKEIQEGVYQTFQAQNVHTSILELLAKISGNKTIAKELVDLGITKYINIIFKPFVRKTLNEQETYQLLHILKLIQNTAVLGEEVANEYILAKDSKISALEDIKEQIGRWMDVFRANDYSFAVKEDLKLQEIKYRLFSSFVTTLGRLAHYLSSEMLMELLNKFGYNLLAYATLDKTEPLLLTSVCSLAYDIVSSETGRKSRTCVENVFNSLGRLIPLLHYMGESYAAHMNADRYKYLCEAAELYHSGTLLKNEPVPLEANTNPVVHNLFIAIIKLITFVCKYSNITGHIQEKCLELSDGLNKSGRETILFSCLVMPSDDVKLAVARCLDEVSVKEIEADEMAYFSRLLSNYKNLGAGKTEEVLSLIFIIMTKILRDNGPGAHEFVNKFSQNAINDALDILGRNMERDLRGEPEEQEEKAMLSLSCIYFLKTASENPIVRVYMVDQNALASMKKSLYFEEQLMKFYPLPINIENTFIGRNMEYLFRCMTGHESLDPRSLVSYRIVSRIADLLTGVEDIRYETLQGETAIERLKVLVGDEWKKKLQRETRNWENFERDLRKILGRLQENDIEKENFIQQHKLISSFDGLNRLISFILKNESITRGDQNRHFQLTLNADFKKKISSLQLKSGYKKKNQDHHVSERKTRKHKDNFSEELKANLQRHQVSALQMDRKELAKFTLEPPTKSVFEMAAEGTIGKKQKDIYESYASVITVPGSESDKVVKILIISSILRVIHGAIHYFIDPETKKDALQQLKNVQIIQPITELCASVGWTEANVATKYLSIMHELLEELQFEKDETIIKDILDIVSQVAADILKILQKKLQNVQKIPLSYEDNTLIYHLSTCCALICARVASMRLLTEHEMNIVMRVVGDSITSESNSHSLFAQKPERLAKQMTAKFLLSKLVPLPVIYALLDIVFINMAKYSNPQKEVDINEYERADVTNRAISVLLAEYFSNCVDHKYSILKYFTDAEIYQNKFVKQTFLQETLMKEQMIRLRNAMQDYIKEKKYTNTSSDVELITEIYNVEALEQGKTKGYKKIIGFSNHGLLLFTPSTSKPCSVCPPDALCPEGPTLYCKCKYSELPYCVDFTRTNKLGFVLSKDEGIMSLLNKKKNELRLIVSFLEKHDKKSAINMLRSYGVTIVPDFLLEVALSHELKENLDNSAFISFVHVFSHENVTQDDYFSEKKIIVLNRGHLIMLNEASEHWLVEIESANQAEREEMRNLDIESTKKLANFDPRTRSMLYLSKKMKSIPLSKITSFLVDDNGLPIGEVKAGKEEIKMLFGGESELDRFRIELFKNMANPKVQMKTELYSAVKRE